MKILRKSPYSVRIQENADQKKFRIWTLSRSDMYVCGCPTVAAKSTDPKSFLQESAKNYKIPF